MAFGDIVQGPIAANTSTHIATLGSNPTVGNLLVFIAGDVAGNLAPGTGLSTAVIVEEPFGVDDLGIFYRIVQGGDDTTWDVSSGNNTVGILIEVEGPFQATPVDVTASNTGADDPPTQTTGTTSTTTNPIGLAIGAITYRDTAGAVLSWSNSFVDLTETTSPFQALFVATKLLSTLGTVETTATLSGGAGRAWGAIAVFKSSNTGDPVYPSTKPLTIGIDGGTPARIHMTERNPFYFIPR